MNLNFGFSRLAMLSPSANYFKLDVKNMKNWRSDVKQLLENFCFRSLHLREDIVKNDVSRQELFSHCATCIENYYITPAANAKNDLKQSIDQPSTKIIQSVQEEKACEN